MEERPRLPWKCFNHSEAVPPSVVQTRKLLFGRLGAVTPLLLMLPFPDAGRPEMGGSLLSGQRNRAGVSGIRRPPGLTASDVEYT